MWASPFHRWGSCAGLKGRSQLDTCIHSSSLSLSAPWLQLQWDQPLPQAPAVTASSTLLTTLFQTINQNKLKKIRLFWQFLKINWLCSSQVWNLNMTALCPNFKSLDTPTGSTQCARNSFTKWWSAWSLGHTYRLWNMEQSSLEPGKEKEGAEQAAAGQSWSPASGTDVL